MLMSQPPRILVIDDERAIRMVIEACLVDLGGWEVLEAGSGAAGLALAATESIDGILLDISMPEMDGIATLGRLKKNPQTAQIPVILLTAKVQAADQELFAHLPIVATVAKPFDPLTLVDQLATAFGWKP
jgi:CheY-like chemotaxis protein